MRLFFARLLSYFPTQLPVGIAEFNDWAESILTLSGRFANEDSMKYALATMVIHADSKFGALPKAYFVKRLRKSAANQVASQVFQDIKQKQADEAKKAAEEEKQSAAEVTDVQKD